MKLNLMTVKHLHSSSGDDGLKLSTRFNLVDIYEIQINLTCCIHCNATVLCEFEISDKLASDSNSAAASQKLGIENDL